MMRLVQEFEVQAATGPGAPGSPLRFDNPRGLPKRRDCIPPEDREPLQIRDRINKIYKRSREPKFAARTGSGEGSRVEGFKGEKGVKRQVRSQKTEDRRQKGEERSMKGEEGPRVRGSSGNRQSGRIPDKSGLHSARGSIRPEINETPHWPGVILHPQHPHEHPAKGRLLYAA